MNYKIMGERIRTRRLSNHITQSKLALMTNTTQRQISLYETGLQIADTSSLIKICIALNTSLDYLCGLTNYPEPLQQLDDLENKALYLIKKMTADKAHVALGLLEKLAE